MVRAHIRLCSQKMYMLESIQLWKSLYTRHLKWHLYIYIDIILRRYKGCLYVSSHRVKLHALNFFSLSLFRVINCALSLG